MRDAKPVQNIRHEFLMSCILDSCDPFRIVEIFSSRIDTSFSPVVHHVLDDFAQSSTLFLEVYYDSESSPLGTLDSFCNPEYEIRSTGADVTSEYVGSGTAVVHSTGDFGLGVVQLGRIAHDVHRQTTDRGKENFDIGSSEEFRIHSCGALQKCRLQGGTRLTSCVFEQCPSQYSLFDAHPLGDTRKEPDWVNGRFAAVDLDTLIDPRKGWKLVRFDDDIAVDFEITLPGKVIELFDLDASFCLSDGGSHIKTFGVLLSDSPSQPLSIDGTT